MSQAAGVDFCACASYKWLMGDFGLGFFYVREDLLDRVMPRVQHGWRQIEDFEYHMLPHDAPGPFPGHLAGRRGGARPLRGGHVLADRGGLPRRTH